jgi:hypothetical protein
LLRQGSDAESLTRPSAYNVYAEGHSYAEGRRVSAEGDLRRGATPTAALGVGYADGLPWLGRGLSTVGAVADSCSAGRTCTRYMIVLSFFISGVVVVRVLACRDMSRGARPINGTYRERTCTCAWPACGARFDRSIRPSGTRDPGRSGVSRTYGACMLCVVALPPFDHLHGPCIALLCCRSFNNNKNVAVRSLH